MAYLGIMPLQEKEGEFQLSVYIKVIGYVKIVGSAFHLIRCHVVKADRIPLFIFPVSQ
jgi:hypothetical protein